MPYTVTDVDKHKAGLSDKEKRQWVEIANSVLERCLADGGSEESCAAKAIQQASGVLKKQQEADMPDFQKWIEVLQGAERIGAQEDDPEGLRYIQMSDTLVGELIRDLSEVTKTVGGKSYPASDFLVVEDSEKPNTWHLQVKRNGEPDHGLMGGAWAALHGGYRGNKYEGPNKQEAIAKLKALYKAEDMETPSAEADFGEQWASIESLLGQIRGAFNRAFGDSGGAIKADAGYSYWVRDVLAGHPELGNSVVVEDGGLLYAVGYKMEDGKLQFAAKAEWMPVVQTYTKMQPSQQGEVSLPGESTVVAGESTATETEIAESASGHVLSLAEAHVAEAGASGALVPLHLDVALITPGWGNSRDNHYYPREVLERDAGVFAGVKMYETDHRSEEKSTRTWVSTVKEIAGHMDDGAPIGRVSVHDRNFAERLMALDADGLLEKMECSILAAGTARKGKVGERKGHVVEAITSADSVDWVTRAGAGGRALSLAESEHGGEPMDEERTIEEQESEEAQGGDEPTQQPLEEVTLQEQQGDQEAGQAQDPEPEEPPAPAKLAQERVRELVGASTLPDASKARLSEAEYADEAGVEAAVEAEVAYLKEVTGSGKPFAQGAGDRPEHKPRTAEEAEADWKRILTEVGVQV